MSSIYRRELTVLMKLFKKLFVVILAFAAVGCAKSASSDPVRVSGVELNFNTYTLALNDKFQLEATVNPSDATNKNVTWRSSNTNIVSISDTGLVSAVGIGTAKVFVVTEENSFFDTCDITVIANVVHVEKVTLNKTTLSIKQGGSSTITATISPSNASNKNVTWFSSDTSVATVKNGLVTGVSKGEATITAKSVDGGITATCNVSITEPTHVSGITLSSSTLTLKQGNTATLTATISPSDAYDKSVSWSSSNTSIASVDQKGVVTAGNTIGNVAITATTTDGGYQATCTVTVEEKSLQDKWTILIYMCGSTLESQYANKYTEGIPYNKCGFAVCDIREIIDTPNKPDDVNIVFETGGSNTWTTNANGKYSNGYTISSQYIQRHHVENGKIVLDSGQDKIKNEKMGKQSVLQSFLEYGLTNYPAEKTALILWNHGGGMQGACFNDAGGGYCDEDGLLGKEVVGAVSSALTKCGLSGQKLEWIGYDACMMQIQDLAEQYSPYFKYMLGSQELENGTGWDYDTWLDDLYNGKDTETILKAIVDGFIAENGGVNDYENDQTLSYLDLSYASSYKTVWEDFALKLKNDKVVANNRSAFNDLIYSTKIFSNYPSEGIYYRDNGLSDAKDFINAFKKNTTLNKNGKYNTELQNILDAHSNLVKYFSAGAGAGNAYGLSMFWAIEQTTKTGNPYTAGTDTNFTNWAYLSNNYYGTESTTGNNDDDWEDWGWGW